MTLVTTLTPISSRTETTSNIDQLYSNLGGDGNLNTIGAEFEDETLHTYQLILVITVGPLQ